MSLFAGQAAVASGNAVGQLAVSSAVPHELFPWDRLRISAISCFHVETVPFGTSDNLYVHSMISMA